MRNITEFKFSKIILSFFLLFIFYKVLNLLINQALQSNDVLQDLYVYTFAVDNYEAGINPYVSNGPLFIYHPYVLMLFCFINKIVPLEVFLLIFYLLSAVFFFRQLFLISRERFPEMDSRTLLTIYGLLVLGTMGYSGTGFIALLSGNLTLFLHFTLIGLLLKFLRSRSSVPMFYFIFLVGAFSLIKPYYLAYLLVLFVFFPVKNAIVYGILVFTIVSIVWLSAVYVMPLEYTYFKNALHTQILTKEDLGFSVFGLASSLFSISYWNSLLIHICILSPILFMCFDKPRVFQFNDDYIIRSLILVVTIILINPRMKEYDFFIAIISVFFIVFLNYGIYALPALLMGFILSNMASYGLSIANKLGIQSVGVLLNSRLMEILILMGLMAFGSGLIWSKKIRMKISHKEIIAIESTRE